MQQNIIAHSDKTNLDKAISFKAYLAAAVLLGLFLLVYALVGNVQDGDKITMAWAWTESGDSGTYIKQLDAAKHLGVISPTGIYAVDGDGVLVNKIDSSLVEHAHRKGQKVWALFANQDFSKDTARAILSSPARQARVIREVTQMAVKNNYDGVNIDWENMYTEDRGLFTEFVRKLAASLKAQNKVVSVDITVLISDRDEQANSTWVNCYERKALGEIVDYVVLMAYDEHNQFYPNGSVASLPWVEKGVQSLLQVVPAEKIILGVPFYTDDFSAAYKKGARYIDMGQTQDLIAQNKASVYWDAGLGQHVATYYKNGYKHTIWVEDDKSLGLKLDLVNKYNLAGMSAWSLGSEGPATWDVIGTKTGKASLLSNKN